MLGWFTNARLMQKLFGLVYIRYRDQNGKRAKYVLIQIWIRRTRTPEFWENPNKSQLRNKRIFQNFKFNKSCKQRQTSGRCLIRCVNMKWIRWEKFNKSYKRRQTSGRCLIRCVNMKWIRWVLLKIQSGHDSVHRITEGRARWNQYAPFQLGWSGRYNNNLL